MAIALQSLQPRIAGYNVIDCEVKDSNTLYLLAREDYTQRLGWRELQDAPSEGRLAKRIFVLRLNETEEKMWGHMHLTGMHTSMCSMSYAPEHKIIVVDTDAKVWAQNPKTNGFEAGIPYKSKGGVLAGSVNRAKAFGGEVFACATQRQIFKRVGPSNWELVGGAIPISESEFGNCGFEDFDRFSESDVYAAGGSGDLWHFDGTTWNRCRFPNNWGLSAVKCAPDGNVYVAAGTAIFRGVGNQWERLKTKTPMSLPIKDLVWYEGRLWATNDYGTWTLQGNRLIPAEVPSGVAACSGNLAVRDGVLLLAGYGGAAFKRNGCWTEIFHDHDVRQWFEGHRGQVWTPPTG